MREMLKQMRDMENKMEEVQENRRRKNFRIGGREYELPGKQREM